MRGLEISKKLATSSDLQELSQLKVGDKLSVAILQSLTGSLGGDGGLQQCLTSAIGRLE